jgi:hypothetical protein
MIARGVKVEGKGRRTVGSCWREEGGGHLRAIIEYMFCSVKGEENFGFWIIWDADERGSARRVFYHKER